LQEQGLDMKLYNLLSEKKSAILNRWYDAVLDTYPSDTSGFLKGQKNPFLNPVGSTIFQGIENLFEELLCENNSPIPSLVKGSEGGLSGERVSLFLDNIIRIRAVQEFTPSQAVAFVLLLKNAIREELKSELVERQLLEELLFFESKIDDMALLSFDIYMKCREKLFQLKVNELQSGTFRKLQRADEICNHEHNLKCSNDDALERKEVNK
ncbi:MAG: RsbRD N-terminal domain-containing protein, partial [Nitrospirota bacterium]